MAGALAVAFLGTGWPANTAHACTFTLEPALQTLPPTGATDVPTDVQLTVDLGALDAFDLDDMQFELTEADGEPIALVVTQPFVWHAVVTPQAPLSANAEHTLSVEWMDQGGRPYTASMTFRTGEGPLSAPPTPPSGALEHYETQLERPNSCSPQRAGTCVMLDDDVTVVAHDVDGQGPFSSSYTYLYTGSFLTNLSGVDQGTPFTCVDLQTRALNGQLSAPLRLCRDDGPLRHLEQTLQEVRCESSGFVYELAGPQDHASAGSAGEETAAAAGAGGASGEADNDSLPPPSSGTDGAQQAAGSPAAPPEPAAQPNVDAARSGGCAVHASGAPTVGFGWAICVALALARRRRSERSLRRAARSAR